MFIKAIILASSLGATGLGVAGYQNAAEVRTQRFDFVPHVIEAPGIQQPSPAPWYAPAPFVVSRPPAGVYELDEPAPPSPCINSFQEVSGPSRGKCVASY